MTDRELEERLAAAFTAAAPDCFDRILTLCTPQRQQSARLFTETPPAGFLRVILDVNPSISLQLDEQEIVTGIFPLNEDAKKVLDGLSLTRKPLDEAVDAIVEAMVEKGYLSEVQNSILVSVEGNGAESLGELQRKVSGMIAEVMKENLGGSEEETSVISQTISQDEELTELAGEYGISVGKAALIRKMVNKENAAMEENTTEETLKFEDMAPMSVNDIALLAEDNPIADGTVRRTGRPSERAYIGHRAALEKALNLAGVSLSQVYKQRVKFGCSKGRMDYKVNLKTARGKFKVLLDARTGDPVYGGEYEKKEKKYGEYYYRTGGRGYKMSTVNNYGNGSMEPVTMPEGVISEQQAKEAALAHAGVSEAETLYVYVHPEIDNGRVEHYDVKFVANGMKYKYAIGLYDGAVLGRAVKDKRMKTGYVYEGNYHEHTAPMGSIPQGAPQAAVPQTAVPQAAVPQTEVPQAAAPQMTPQAAPQPTPQAAPQPAPQAVPQMAPQAGGMISEDDALCIALNYAGLTLNDIYRWRMKLRAKRGRVIYRVHLKVQGFEYEIDVDAYSGAITKAQKEYDF